MEINSNSLNFGKKNIVGSKMVPKLSDTKIINEILKKGREELWCGVEEFVHTEGKFKKVLVRFDIPNTNNEAIVAVVHDEINPQTSRHILVGVHNKYSDKLFTEYLFEGSNSDIIQFLKDDGKQSQLQESILSLSQKTDEYFSSL